LPSSYPKSYRSHGPVEFLGSHRAVPYSGRPVQYSAILHACVVTFAFNFSKGFMRDLIQRFVEITRKAKVSLMYYSTHNKQLIIVYYRSSYHIQVHVKAWTCKLSLCEACTHQSLRATINRHSSTSWRRSY
jgi:hypothetical protein